ncbi:hypothetical protein [Cupriavidus sp. CP313]
MIRGNYQYMLRPSFPGVPEMPQRGRYITQRIDGIPLTMDVHPRTTRLAQWLPYVLVFQLLLLISSLPLIACCWFAVRLAIRLLKTLADAADALTPNAEIATNR